MLEDDIDSSTFYPVDVIEKMYQLKPGEILNDASRVTSSLVKLCIHIPENHDVYTVDISATDCGVEKRLESKMWQRYVKPNKAELPIPINKDNVVALVMDPQVLNKIKRNWPHAVQLFFHEAYLLKGLGHPLTHNYLTLFNI